MNQDPISLLDAFRYHYNRIVEDVHHVNSNATDTVVIERLMNDLAEYSALVNEHLGVFDDPAELDRLQTSLPLMMEDVRISHGRSIDQSNHGHPQVVHRVQTGRRGQPRIEIDADFLHWAHNRRSISGLARFLGVGRTTVRNTLLRLGLLPGQGSGPNHPQHMEDMQTPGDNVHALPPNNHPPPLDNPPELQEHEDDDLLEPDIPVPAHLNPSVVTHVNRHGRSLRTSQISDEELDQIILRLRSHYRRAGLTMLDGMLRRLGYTIPRDRIRHSLLRIDPVRRVFERIRIRRRTYSVPGPNALWHHDGQHGLIRWGIVVHGFIDGYSRLITGLRASSNNHGTTVLELFLEATAKYGVPSRLRGDHGTENILIAAWMEERNGRWRGSYIWGRYAYLKALLEIKINITHSSVHNVRIERLWVDITSQIGATWASLFTTLEMHHGLDINNPHHIWLLHFLFLPTINQDLDFFVGSWNEHKIQIRNGPNRSPIDMFNFDMLVYGVRGTSLEDAMSPEELEVYGIDWEGLRDDRILQSQRSNNSIDEPPMSWVGREGPPDNLNEILLADPELPLTYDECVLLEEQVEVWVNCADDASVILAWSHGLAFVRHIKPGVFL